MPEKIMVVDDEEAIADLVEVCLKNEGYQVYKYYNAADALQCVGQEEISLAILDVMLPDMDGFALCQRIRQEHFFPIIMLTAKVDAMDKITGLTMGADDYVTKPFHPLELITRVKSQLRRYTRYNPADTHTREEEGDQIDIRGLSIASSNHKCTLNGRELSLTPVSSRFCCISASARGRWFLPRSCLRQSGGRSIWTATIPLWLTLPA